MLVHKNLFSRHEIRRKGYLILPAELVLNHLRTSFFENKSPTQKKLEKNIEKLREFFSKTR
jgi:hypothetical protein